MALSGLDIYKLLPKTNCKKCGLPTCLAFAMKLAMKKASIDECPDISEEAKRALKNKGQILVVDWLPESVLGPKEGRLSPADVREIADKIGLKCKKDFMAGSCHWGMVLVK